MASLVRCWENCSSTSLRSYGISISIKQCLHVVLEHIRLQRHLPFISFMVDIHTCWVTSMSPCQTMQNQPLTMRDSSSYNRSERTQLLRHMTERSRIRTLEMNLSSHINFRKDNGY